MMMKSTYTFVIISLFSSLAGCQECTIGQIACDGRCVSPCDGFTDCKDGADETTSLCSAFACNSEDSLSVDGLGEIGGIFHDVEVMALKKFRCKYGGCIGMSFVCNGRANCWDGSDEAQCSGKSCGRFEFQCGHGGCIRNVWKCDGKKDCLDGSDETEQLCKNARCPSRKRFKCAYGACTEEKEKCNGLSDCTDGSDESPQLCGSDHTFTWREDIVRIPLAETNPQPTVPPPSPLVPTHVPTPPPPPPLTPGPMPPPRATPAPPPSQPVTEVTDPCIASSQCTCQGSGICVPCDRLDYCLSLVNGPKCLLPSNTDDNGITVDVLACGHEALVNVAAFSRNRDVLCSSERVPLETVVMADCWGTATLLAQCREDGKWHPYGEHLKGNTVEPMRHLCQPETVNSIICGRRPRYRRPVFPHFSYSGVQQWPWLSTLFRNFTYACTATIISQDFMITAAHCVTTSEVSRKIVDKRGLTVQYLSDDGRVRSSYLTEVHIHPSYMGGSRPGKDIALLKLERPVTFSHKVVPACLGTESFPEASIAATFNHSGGNETHWNVILQQYDQRCQIPQDRCQTLDIDTDQFCAIDIGGLSFLPKGASGGPFLVNLGNDVKEEWTVEGIVSAASGVYLCKRPFTIFSRVSDFWPWIRNCVHNAVCS